MRHRDGQVAIPVVAAQPCYLPFEGDNGGATDDGVTADTIKIVVYLAPDADPMLDYITDAIAVDDTNDDAEDTTRQARRRCSRRTTRPTAARSRSVLRGEGVANDATTARADAVKIDEDIKPFMVRGGPTLTEAFGEELAARGILCIGCAGRQPGASSDRAPYGTVRHRQRAGSGPQRRGARQAGGRTSRRVRRRRDAGQGAGVRLPLHRDRRGRRPANARTRSTLEEAASRWPRRSPYALDPATLQETAANAIARLKEAGVTTIIFAGDPVAPRDFTKEATKQDYFPEWFLNISVLIDTNVFARTYDQEQWPHAFGITALAARVEPGDRRRQVPLQVVHGEEPAAVDTIGVILPGPASSSPCSRRSGPNLTYETSATRVPASSRRRPPHRASLTWGQHGRWPGIEGDDWDGIDDITKIWWDPEDVGPTRSRTRRRRLAVRRRWQALLRRRVARGGLQGLRRGGHLDIYEETPESEAPPDYEPCHPGS